MITSLDTVFPLALSLGFGAVCDYTSILWGFIWEVSSAFFRYMDLNTVALISTSSALVWNIITFLVSLKMYKAAILSSWGFSILLFFEQSTRKYASDNYDP